MEAIGYHELRRGDRIFPFGIATKQDVHNGNAEFSLFRINGLGTSTEIFLTNDGTNVDLLGFYCLYICSSQGKF